MRDATPADTRDSVDASETGDAAREVAPPLAPGPPNQCVSGGPPVIAWEQLNNPILAYGEAAVKDVAVHWMGDRWLLMMSYIVDDPFRFRIGIVESPDLASFSEPVLWDDAEVGGLASPDLSPLPGGAGWGVVFNSHTTDVHSSMPKLYRRT